MNIRLDSITDKTLWHISELNQNVRLILEQAFPLLWVTGEISNFKRYPSGHWYFSLKDDNAQVRCVMFRHKNTTLDWHPEDGMRVEARASVTLYEARGDFQLTVEHLRRAGLGRLFEAFEQLKTKLRQQGLFDTILKRSLPKYPKQIGVITSSNTAALRDVLITLHRRMPAIPIIIYPTPVQGENAAGNIVAALRLAAQRAECDVLILCRGGGSIEDLWAFNEEKVVLAIAACPIPVVTGIGHETDFTIADFVADARAPTPTGAAQLVCPDTSEIKQAMRQWRHRLQQSMERKIESCLQTTDLFAHRLTHPGDKIHQQQINLTQLQQRLLRAGARQLENHQWHIEVLKRRISASQPDIAKNKRYQLELATRLVRAMNNRMQNLTCSIAGLVKQLSHLDPQAVLARGYSIAYTAQGDVLRHYRQVSSGDNVQVVLAHGRVHASVVKSIK
ncbi:exodeoxyribonuclease VII large subunit [Nitrosomonas mobilis]|uniref:Exodeoxyribonuclease 7 large subunit n=1 Tax=Nitrosomonas mobilis TaxID=51642 RepID=A0A1G5SCY8_9PROT|nr:exodeoxyribonuclease VII large subunit [Nitrosomonas mobilis]SCZ84857.1 Exodeoxyribonuclease 7 large subunit [Nitrosomonas mobilis]